MTPNALNDTEYGVQRRSIALPGFLTTPESGHLNTEKKLHHRKDQTKTVKTEKKANNRNTKKKTVFHP